MIIKQAIQLIMLVMLASGAVNAEIQPSEIKMPSQKESSQIEVSKNDELAQKLQKAKQKLDLQERKSRQLLSALYQIQLQMKTVVKKKSQILKDKAQLQQVLDQTQTQLTTQESQVVAQRNQLGQRIKSISQMKGQSLFQVLLSSQSPHQLDKSLKILSLIADKDIKLIKQYNVAVKQLAKDKLHLAQRLEKMKNLEQESLQQENELLKQQASRQIILKQFQKDKKLAQQKIEQLRQTSIKQNQDDFGLLDPLMKPSFSEKKGQLTWPVVGQLAKPFGIEKLSDSSVIVYNKGVFIKSLAGATIKAVAEGKVIYLGEVQGLGKTVVIDHGDHFYTVYSNARDIFVSLNATVAENQKIASADLGHFETEPGLYFEIRHFSEPTDPVRWMKGNIL